jgi:hypothetical protein
MANTFKFGNGEWAVGKETALAYNDENSNFKPLPFTFDRASTATVVNKDGLIETVGVDEPRIDFLNNTNGHLLLEPSRLNNTTYSDGNISTFGSQAGSSSDADTPINGFENSIQIELDSVDSLVYKRDFTPTIGFEYTFSFFVQMDDNTAPLQSLSASDGDFSIIVNNGVATDVSKIKTEKLGASNIYRVSATDTATSTNNRYGVIKYSTQSNKGFRVTGIQLEEGSYATSYIPTSGQSGGVTRSAETANGAGNSNVFNDSEGVLYAEIAKDTTSVDGGVAISDSSYTNRVLFYFDTAGNIRAYVYSSGEQVRIDTSGLDYTQNNKLALKYSATSTKFYVNGFQVGSTDTGSTMPVGLSELAFDDGGGGSDFYGKVKDIRYYNTALSDSELQALTS